MDKDELRKAVTKIQFKMQQGKKLTEKEREIIDIYLEKLRHAISGLSPINITKTHKPNDLAN